MQTYLLCPKCGVKLFYVKTEENKQIYFHVDYDFKAFPSPKHPADVSNLDISHIRCTKCPWTGSPRKLIKFYSRSF